MAKELPVEGGIKSNIITIDLLDYRPKAKSLFFDLKEGLFMEMILKEKEFRHFLSEINWELFRDQAVAIGCSSEAIIPFWAYMSVADKLSGIASIINYSTPEALDEYVWKKNIEQTDFSFLQGEKVVVRQSIHVPPSLYIAITQQLKPFVTTLMYGEAGLPKVISKNKTRS